MLITYSLSRPDDVWEKCWHYLIDGILYKQQNDQKNLELVLLETQLKNLALLEIENFLLRNNCTLRCFPTMSFPDDDSILATTNRFMNKELAYDTEVMTGEFERLFISLTDEQRDVYNQIMEAVDQKRGGIILCTIMEGWEKLFLWKTLSASIRSKRKIVLNVASSGIASLLLEGGRTAHSRFLIPINLTEDSTCSIKRNPDICKLINKTDLIIWDEAPMIHKHAFEALDRALKYVIKDGNRSNCQHPFGSKVIVFGGDFRQILPVVQHGSRSDIVNASLSSSHIWTKCKVLRLTKNMRLTVGCQSSNLEDTIRFVEWLLELGERKLGGDNDGNAIIEIPDNLLIRESSDLLSNLIDFFILLLK
ncbi:ATP-dependent DNA helicase pfh1-like [Bidens hawaiensis]|uniref:ATP-dependent DNA helicase pfh1-like n=1 Tax=Bidens hawaiensis TaxID=980011 RepID=UPI00404A6290